MTEEPTIRYIARALRSLAKPEVNVVLNSWTYLLDKTNKAFDNPSTTDKQISELRGATNLMKRVIWDLYDLYKEEIWEDRLP